MTKWKISDSVIIWGEKEVKVQRQWKCVGSRRHTRGSCGKSEAIWEIDDQMNDLIHIKNIIFVLMKLVLFYSPSFFHFLSWFRAFMKKIKRRESRGYRDKRKNWIMILLYKLHNEIKRFRWAARSGEKLKKGRYSWGKREKEERREGRKDKVED